jgi:mannose-1-phosphate guanylyltransferase
MCEALDRYAGDKPVFTMLADKATSFNSNDGYCVTDESGRMTAFLEKPARQAFEDAAATHILYRCPMLYVVSRNIFAGILAHIAEPWQQQAEQLLSADAAARPKIFLVMPFTDMGIAYQQAPDVRVVRIEYQFVDVGRFQELYQLNDKDTDGNVIMGTAVLDGVCANNLIINLTDAPLAVLSISDSVIVQTSAGSLVTPFSEAARIGEIYKSRIHSHE